jgi:2-dehydro-3-deoxygalactonokinase
VNKWIAVDWGTSSFRAYLLQNNQVIDNIISKDGMKFIKQIDFETIFIKLIEKWLIKGQSIQVLASGMLGARQGWFEAPYEIAPCNLKNIKFISPIINDQRFKLKIFSGISQINEPDVMRGEETQVAGFFYDNPSFKGSICLPGTHSKWIKVDNSYIEKFKTFMTGELFEVISKYTVLKHSILSEDIDKNEFVKSVEIIIKNPENIGSALFQLRADDLINSQGNIIYQSRLSGYLLGLELLGSAEFWENKNIVLIGNKVLVELYSFVLKNKVTSIKECISDEMLLKGLKLFKDKIIN